MERPHDPLHPLRGFAEGGVGVGELIHGRWPPLIRLELEQLDAAGDDRQGVLQLVGDARSEAPERGELLVLVERLPLALKLVVGALTLSRVTLEGRGHLVERPSEVIDFSGAAANPGPHRQVAGGQPSGGVYQSIDLAEDEHVSTDPRRPQRQEGDDPQQPQIASERPVGGTKRALHRDPDAEVDVTDLGCPQERRKAEEALDAVEPTRHRHARALREDRPDRRRRQGLSDPSGGFGMAHEDRALLVHRGDGRARRKIDLGHELIEPAQIERREEDGRHPPVPVEHRVADVDRGFARDATDLILPHRERPRRQGSAKVGPVGQVDRPRDRGPAAIEVSLRVDRADVRVERVLRHEPRQQLVALSRVVVTDGGELRQPDDGLLEHSSHADCAGDIDGAGRGERALDGLDVP